MKYSETESQVTRNKCFIIVQE